MRGTIVIMGERTRLADDQPRQNKYGHTLAHVYLEDGTLVHAEIIRQGYGVAYTRFPFKHAEQFRQLERGAKRGSWGGITMCDWSRMARARP